MKKITKMRSAITVVLIFASFQSLDCLNGMLDSRLNYFDIDLLRYAAENKNGNVMVSPASMKSTLAMLLEGAQGTTASEIRTALRLSPMKDDYREELHLFLRALEAHTSSVSLQNANALFVSNKLQLKKEYETMAKNVYFSDVHKLDFNYPTIATNAINSWVSSKTKGLIPDIIDEAHISPTTELLVINALYFKSPWKYQFQSSSTHGDCFYKDGICNTVAMMDLEAELNYAYVDNLRAHALELPYQGNRYSMILLVPQDRDAGVALIRDLPYIGLLQISDIMSPTHVILTMPKFTVEYSDDMVATLRNMHITSLFSSSANLSGILEGTKAYVSSIFHKVYMSVDEKGTVAAAASAGIVVPLINDLVQLRVDRPFLFFIRDNNLGLVLFEGKIEEPTQYVAIHNRIVETQDKKQQEPRQPISTIHQTNPPRPVVDPLSPIEVPIKHFQSKPIVTQPASTPIMSSTSTVSQMNPTTPVSTGPIPVEVPNQPLDRQPIVRQSSSSSPITSPPTPSPPISTPPILDLTSTTPSSRKSGGNWLKKLSEIFG